MENDIQKFLESIGEPTLQLWQQEIFDKLENAVKNSEKVTIHIPRPTKRITYYRSNLND